jgi:hypothetical protein
MNWTDDPATEKQLVQLRSLGFTVVRPLTCTEAARLIRQYQRNPLRASAPPSSPDPPDPPSGFDPLAPAPRFDPSPESMTGSQGSISDSTKMEVHRLRAAVEDARRVMTLTPDAPNARADFASNTTRRQEFWLDTCREVKEMQIGSVQVFELYQRYGCRLYGPSRPQVQEVLDALDSAMPLWDRDHPELFYQTLELNFPELVKKPR